MDELILLSDLERYFEFELDMTKDLRVNHPKEYIRDYLETAISRCAGAALFARSFCGLSAETVEQISEMYKEQRTKLQLRKVNWTK